MLHREFSSNPNRKSDPGKMLRIHPWSQLIKCHLCPKAINYTLLIIQYAFTRGAASDTCGAPRM